MSNPRALSRALPRTEHPHPSPQALRVFGNKPFMRFARQFGVSSADLLAMFGGEPAANLGDGVYKFLLARAGEGKSAGARTIVAMRKDECVVLMFGFEKKDMANISERDLRGFKKLAKAYLESSSEGLENLVRKGELTEIRVTHLPESGT